jgi:sigma-B regulation protein RsbU (phosphoserine phosphatase)
VVETADTRTDTQARLLDPARLAAVQGSGLLDSDPEPVFDDLAWMAARLLDTPLAMITAVDDRRSYRKSYVGSAAFPTPAGGVLAGAGPDGTGFPLAIDGGTATVVDPDGAVVEGPVARVGAPAANGVPTVTAATLAALGSALRDIPVDESLCRYVIDSASPVVVGRGHSSPADGARLVLGGLEIRSWVGYPVLSADGQVIGAFAVADPIVRGWTDTELEALRTLTRSVSTEIAGRQLASRAQASRQQSLELSGQAQQLRRQNHALVSAVRQSLVPAGRWTVGPLDVAVSVAPGADALTAADFVDVTGISAGRWGIVVGHVHDDSVDAAATAAFVRQSLRAEATSADSPAAALRSADHALFDRAPFSPAVSCAALWLGAAAGRLAIQASVAGDLVPAVRDANGRLRWLGRPTGPLGNEFGPRRTVHPDELGPGEALVLVSPSVVLAAGPGGAEPFGADRLASVLRVTGTQSPAEVARTVLDAAAKYAGDARVDDLVVLVVQPGAGRRR